MFYFDYVLVYIDWYVECQVGDGDVISCWMLYDKFVVLVQKELSKLFVYQWVYQSLKMWVLGVFFVDFNLCDQVGLIFDQVFIFVDDNKLVVLQFFICYGL